MGHENYIISYAEGTGNNLAKAKNRTASWAAFKKILKLPTVTPELRRAFDKMSKGEQDRLKSVGGWISGAQCEGQWRNKKNILPRDLATLDIDYSGAELTTLVEQGLTGISHLEFVSHSSRRHTPDEPRLRFYVPLSRKVSVDEYTAIIRFLGWLLDREMKLVDPVSYRPAQMMFKPSCCKDDRKHYFFYENRGELLDADEALAQVEAIFGSWTDLNALPKSPDEDNLRKRADKAEDPLEKRGPVGDFCRAYSIEAAMETFLPGVYIPGDEHSGHPRYTYAGSTSSNGAVVYDDGRFLYSHHGHDPVCDMNVNAFDLVRIHKYWEADEKAKEDTGPKDMPSYKAMMELIAEDPEYRKAQADSRYDIAAMFDDAGIEAEPEPEESEEDIDWSFVDDLVGGKPEPRPEPKKAAGNPHARRFDAAPKDWFPGQLELTKNGDISPTVYNVTVILQYDPRFHGKIGFNEFTRQVVLLGDITSNLPNVRTIKCRDRVTGDRWQDINDSSVRTILEAPNGAGKAGYGMKVSDRDLTAAILNTAYKNSFHPLRERFNHYRAIHDKSKHLLDTLLIRYLKCPDTDYHRQIIRWHLVAAVARVFEPGLKYDYAVIIGGKQGIGKSSFIKVLHDPRWFGEVHCRLDDKQAIAEEIAGKHGLELPEMGAFGKTQHNDAKAFMRRQYDDVRMAFDRRVSEFPRQCVFWGTTNDATYLKDPTGNRSYLPAKTEVKWIDLAALAGELPQVWGEAAELYFQMREAQPIGDLPLALVGADALQEAVQHQEEARSLEVFEDYRESILDWVDRPVTLQQLRTEMGEDMPGFDADEDEFDGTTLVYRNVFATRRAGELALDIPKINNQQVLANVSKAVNELDGWVKPTQPWRHKWGRQRWYKREGVAWEEIERGFTPVGDAEGYEIPDII